MPAERFGRYQTNVEETILERRERLRSAKKQLEICGGLSEGIGRKTYLHGQTDFAKTLKLRFRVGDLDLPERRKWCFSRREEEEEEEEEVDAWMYPCGRTIYLE